MFVWLNKFWVNEVRAVLPGFCNQSYIIFQSHMFRNHTVCTCLVKPYLQRNNNENKENSLLTWISNHHPSFQAVQCIIVWFNFKVNGRCRGDDILIQTENLLAKYMASEYFTVLCNRLVESIGELALGPLPCQLSPGGVLLVCRILDGSGSKTRW